MVLTRRIEVLLEILFDFILCHILNDVYIGRRNATVILLVGLKLGVSLAPLKAHFGVWLAWWSCLGWRLGSSTDWVGQLTEQTTLLVEPTIHNSPRLRSGHASLGSFVMQLCKLVVHVIISLTEIHSAK